MSYYDNECFGKNMPNQERKRRWWEETILYGTTSMAGYCRPGPDESLSLEQLDARRQNNKNYSARIAHLRGERTSYYGSDAVKQIIGALNPLSERCEEPDERLLYRTSSRKHYRMALGLAALLSAEIADQAGMSETVPPTVLVSVDETVGAIERYAAEVPLEIGLVIESIHQMVALTPGAPLEDIGQRN